MNPRTPPVIKVAAALLVLVLGWSAHWVQSQESPEADVGVEAETPDSPEPARNTAPANADPINETSPFDYQASEEISQDRSVSFPVDI